MLGRLCLSRSSASSLRFATTSFRSLFTFVALLCRIVFDLERSACTCYPGHGPLPIFALAGTFLISASVMFCIPPCSPSPPPPTSLLPPPTSLFILASALGIVVSSPSPVHSLPRIYLIASAFGSSYLLTVHDLLPSSFNFGHIALAVTFVVVPAPRTAPPSSVHPCALFMTLRLNEYPRLPVNVRCYLRLHCMLTRRPTLS